VWQSEWDASTKGGITKSCFPIIKERISKSMHMGITLSTKVTGHGTVRAYYYRIKIIDDLKCVCKMGPQTSNHLLWECELIRKQRAVLKNSTKKAGGKWPLTNSDLVKKKKEIISTIRELHKFRPFVTI
jgi:hypothetical protein